MKSKIEDFGEKIGGAKKELWKSRNMILTDTNEMNEREIDTYVIKDNIWHKPDYASMEKPSEVIYFTKVIRDSLPCKPKYNGDVQKIKEDFISFISLVRDVTLAANTYEDVCSIYKKVLFDKYYDFYNKKWKNEGKVLEYEGIITNKFIRNIQIYRISIYEHTKIDLFMKKLKGDSNIKDNSKVEEYGGKFYIYTATSTKYKLLKDISFDSNAKATEFIKDGSLQKLLKEKNERIKIKRPELINIERTGSNYRIFDTTTYEFLNKLKFRGGEFGNWNNQLDRQQILNMAYDALMDLAKVINISAEQIAFDKMLAIAFGARGSGKANAHYEPVKKVINLTKKNGAGSLAHEYGHAFDDFLGNYLEKGKFATEKCGKIVSEEFTKKFTNLMNTMVYKIYKHSQYKKTEHSEYYNNSYKCDKETRKKPYYSTIVEMFARAFESYIEDKINELGQRSDYLVYGTHNCYYSYKIYPEGDERKTINSAFDEVFKELIKENVFNEWKEDIKSEEKYELSTTLNIQEISKNCSQLCFM